MPELYIVLQAAQLLWMVGLTAAIWLRSPGIEAGKAARKVEEDMERALKEQAESTQRQFRDQAESTQRQFGSQLVKITQIETHMSHMPNTQEMQQLHSQVSVIEERTSMLIESIGGLSSGVNRINDWLREHGGRQP